MKKFQIFYTDNYADIDDNRGMIIVNTDNEKLAEEEFLQQYDGCTIDFIEEIKTKND